MEPVAEGWGGADWSRMVADLASPPHKRNRRAPDRDPDQDRNLDFDRLPDRDRDRAAIDAGWEEGPVAPALAAANDQAADRGAAEAAPDGGAAEVAAAQARWQRAGLSPYDLFVEADETVLPDEAELRALDWVFSENT